MVYGWVFNIQRFSIHDGPGIRTTVFLKGCPLRCLWCHNPEGLVQHPQVRLTSNLCTLCGRCIRVCSSECHSIVNGIHRYSPVNCTRCGKCADSCFTGALEVVGQEMTVSEVMETVMSDLPFYQQSGGGMTLSGGEPMMQYGFSRELLIAAKTNGLHTAVETSAHARWEQLSELRPLVDLFLVDIKHIDTDKHRELTGVGNEQILDNIRQMIEGSWPIILRVPWIPTYNNDDIFLDGLVNFLDHAKKSVTELPPVELMLYHRLGIGKWQALGGASTIPPEVPAAQALDAEKWLNRLREAGVRVDISS